jgi:hypothetical protein
VSSLVIVQGQKSQRGKIVTHEQTAELTVELEKIKKVSNNADGSDSESDDNTGQDSYVKNSLLLTRSVVLIQGKESGCLKAGD